MEDHTPRASTDFEADMHALEERLSAMSARCRLQLRTALEVYWRGATAKATEVEWSDAVLDEDERAIDALVLRILALRQPVARDLRFLTTVFKLVTDLERIGDEAVNIAMATIAASPDGADARGTLQQMSDAAEAMVERALRSFLALDEAAASETLSSEPAVRAQYDDVLRLAVAFMSARPSLGPAALSCITVAKCLERIAAHAGNVARGAQFLLGSGDMPR